jgi:hypothetical protein
MPSCWLLGILVSHRAPPASIARPTFGLRQLVALSEYC